MKYPEKFGKPFCFLTAGIVAVSLVGCSSESAETEQTNAPTESLVAEIAETKAVEVEKATEAITKTQTNSTRTPYNQLFSDRDKSAEYGDFAAEIKLNEDSVQCEGDGVSVNGTVVTVSDEGVYHVSGSLADGQIIVNARNSKVQLVLDNADITCKNSSPIYGVDSDKIFLTLAENSVNKLSDGTSYTFADEANSEPDSCIFSGDSLTINGNGSLEINGNYADGIHSKDDVVITGGNITVNSVADGIKGKDYTAICGGKIHITSGQDGIKSTKTDDTALGFVYIEDGDITINSANDGIQAETDVVTTGGNINIVSGGGSENSNKTHNDMGFGGRDFGDFNPDDFENMTPPEGMPEDMTPPEGFENMTPPDGFGGGRKPRNAEAEQTAFTANATDTEATADTAVSDSMKGLKGGNSVEISGGTITVDSADDAIHSNNAVKISGGECVLASGDDGIHSDNTIDISGGAVTISESYEGIEGAVINISGGEISVTSSDDGFNASDGTTSQGGMGAYSDGVALNISNGFVYVDAQGDGLDSNGDMNISGGTILVNGPTNGGNGALDGNREILVNGGLLIVAGSSGMAEAPSENSQQYSVAVGIDATQEAGTLVTLTDESGNEILSFAPAKTFDHIVISSPEIEKGKTYNIEIGGSSTLADSYGLYEKGGYKGDGTSAGSFTADKITSTVGKQSAMGGGFGGGRGDKGDRGHGRGDFQPTTDENGDFVMPERPDFPFGNDREMPEKRAD